MSDVTAAAAKRVARTPAILARCLPVPVQRRMVP